jgi:DNA-binding CsgD family transcriptional regulator
MKSPSLPRKSHTDPNDAAALRVDRIIEDFFRRISASGAAEDLGQALAALGTKFGMPALYFGNNRKTAERWKVQRIFRSPKAPKAVLKALAEHPLAQSAVGAREPVTLTGANLKIGSTGWLEPPALKGLEALVINVETGPNAMATAVFFGRRGNATGLAKSLLTLGTHLAVRRMTLPIWPLAHGRNLTPRELQVIDRASQGMTDAQIGRTLGLATRTVRFHLARAMERAGITSRSQLITKASRDAVASR